MDYTFAQPVRGGYYYIVARADSTEEAVALAVDETNKVTHKEKRDSPFGTLFPEGLWKK